MPTVQSGQLLRKNGFYSVRYYDENGKRKKRGGFGRGREGKTAADEWLTTKLKEVEALRRGEKPRAAAERPTVSEIVADFLELHGATIDEATVRKLRTQLKHATTEFGSKLPAELDKRDLLRWQLTLSQGSRHDSFRAFRQALSWAVETNLADTNPTLGIKNPKRKRHERRDVLPFESWDDVDAIAEELDARYQAIPVVLVGTGLRPEELFGLDRADVDREAGVLHIRRRFTQGVLKDGGKTGGSNRTVPLRKRVLDELEAHRKRLLEDALARGGRGQVGSPVLFPAPRGGRIDLEKFRHREWAPALRAAGIAHRRVYDCRHTFATWAIKGKVEPMEVARIMGTSIRELESTYYRYLTSADDEARERFDQFDRDAALSG